MTNGSERIAEKPPKTTERIRSLYTLAYAWRTSDDIEAGETDLSALRAEQQAEFDRWMTAHDAEQREAGRLAALEEAEKAKAEWQAEALEQLANEDGDWTARAWRPQEAETVVKMRKAILRRAARLRSSSPEGSN